MKILTQAGSKSATATNTDLQQTLDALAGFSGFLTSLVEVWPADAFATAPSLGGRSLGQHLGVLRDAEVERFAVHIRKLLWCQNPVLERHALDPSLAHRPWRVALYELFQARLGNVAVLRRVDAKTFDRVGVLAQNHRFSLRDLVDTMHEHDVAAMADLFQLATECGTWPPGIQKPI